MGTSCASAMVVAPLRHHDAIEFYRGAIENGLHLKVDTPFNLDASLFIGVPE